MNKIPGPGYPDQTSLADGYCAQKQYLKLIGDKIGEKVGYKAGLTNKPIQDRFGATEPVHGILFESMLLQSGTKIDSKMGVKMVYEADLIVTVTDERIN